MKLQQLRYVWEVAHHNLNVSATAQSLYTSQPGISKQIRLLEDELGVEIFTRSGKHFTQITPAGEKILEKAGEVLRTVDSIKQVSQEFCNHHKGKLAIAASYAHTRCILPETMNNFTSRYPEVALYLYQGSTEHITNMVINNSVDFAIIADSVDLYSHGELILIPCYHWRHSILVPLNHPLASENKKISLQDLQSYSLVNYIQGSSERNAIDSFFSQTNNQLKAGFTAADSDVIKSWVRKGLGVGIIAQMLYDSEIDADLNCIDISHIIPPSTAYICIRTGGFLRGFMLEFMHLCSPCLTKDVVESVIQCSNQVEVDAIFENISLPQY